ncbi:MAG: BamA/TamA family outer membrane protein [Flavipsychrobacter sp.]
MSINKRSYRLFSPLVLLAIIFASSCNLTKSLDKGEYLLKSNSIQLKSNEGISEKNELQDDLGSLVSQKPNTKVLNVFPYKLWLYNLRYKKYQKDENNFQLKSKTVERPVIYDSTAAKKSREYMKQYMYQKGYFYSTVKDTAILNPKTKKAKVTYTVNAGSSYLIKNINTKISDSNIRNIVQQSIDNTILKKGKHFSFGLAEQERNRIVTELRNQGYYHFSNDNVSFQIDTLEKDYLKDADNPFESAINFIATQKENKKPTVDIQIQIDTGENKKSFSRYGISNVIVVPDFRDQEDLYDSTMHVVKKHNITFRYRDYYIKEKVIANHTFLQAGRYYAQKDYDKTVSELNQLGIFQSVRVVIKVDTTIGDWITCYVLMNPGDKYETSTNWEISSGTTYDVGSALTLSLRNKNFAKGANLLTVSLSGGLESSMDTAASKSFFNRFYLLSQSAGTNVSIEFPKFLLPISTKRYSIRNAPRTNISVGASLFDRINNFRLINISSKFTYKWNETNTKTWEASPVFLNVIRLPEEYKSTDFKKRLEESEFLANSYRETLIEGESATWTFTDRVKKKGRSYSYVQIGLEEAGALMSGLSGLNLLGQKLDTSFSQYLKLDFNLQHFFKLRSSTLAFRFHGGVGAPYNKSKTLPYIKQYFVGGAYGMRGWRARQLGPGNYYNPDLENSSTAFIDNTGDIKLELNGEYRFEVIEVFAGVMMLHGALFADAGNIWLAQPSTGFEGGDFQFNKFASDLAVDGGIGLRLDIAGFFLVRFDVATKLKNPATATNGNGWAIKDFDFGNPDWRTKNVIMNFAIGYPF